MTDELNVWREAKSAWVLERNPDKYNHRAAAATFEVAPAPVRAVAVTLPADHVEHGGTSRMQTL